MAKYSLFNKYLKIGVQGSAFTFILKMNDGNVVVKSSRTLEYNGDDTSVGERRVKEGMETTVTIDGVFDSATGDPSAICLADPATGDCTPPAVKFAIGKITDCATFVAGSVPAVGNVSTVDLIEHVICIKCSFNAKDGKLSIEGTIFTPA